MTWVAGPEGGRVSPWAFSVPIARIAGTRFRLHWIFLAYGVVVMLRSYFGSTAETNAGGAAGPAVTAQALIALLMLVFVRELTRAMVVRSSGGAADDVTLWPVGTLRGIDPAPGWRCAMAAALAGPCASIVVVALLAIPLGLATGEWIGGAVPDPLDDSWLRNKHAGWVETLWIVQRTGVQLALINMLPMLPLDMGMAMGAVAIRFRGPHDAPRLTANISMVVAAVVSVIAILRSMNTVLAVGVLCFVEAALTLRRIRLGDAVEDARGWQPEPTSREDLRREQSEDALRQKRREQQEAEAREVDRILAKIQSKGIDSLTNHEKEALRKATEQRRGGRHGQNDSRGPKS